MKRSSLRLIQIVGAASFLTLAYSNCAPPGNSVQFTQTELASLSENNDGTDAALPNAELEFSKAVKASGSAKALDIVWVVDNSASMAAEAAHVRNNLSSFMSSISKAANTKVAVISKNGTDGTRVSIGTTSSTRTQWNQSVDSYNSLEKVIEAFSPGGALQGFLRSTSEKVYVVVSDDNSNISANDFISGMQRYFPGQSPKVFGFVGLGKTLSPCQYKTGTVYTELAAQTGGKVYNICEADWTKHFIDLTSEISNLAVPTVALPKPLAQIQILDVTLNGQRLVASKGDYILTENHIQLNPDLFLTQSQQNLKIIYRLK